MDTLIGLAAFLTQFQRFLSHLGVDSLSFNHGDALAEARGGQQKENAQIFVQRESGCAFVQLCS